MILGTFQEVRKIVLDTLDTLLYRLLIYLEFRHLHDYNILFQESFILYLDARVVT